MKVEDVPQDLKYYKGSNVRDITYAVDENGQYKAVVSDGWDAKNDALAAAWDEINEQCEDILERIRQGKTSPLEYHITKNLMDIGLLSSYSGFSQRTIRKHFNPEVFDTLDEKTLDVYADVLRISREELKKVPM